MYTVLVVTILSLTTPTPECFTFISRRHLGMPFGLTFYLDGMMDSRVSACCEFRHQCGKLLGSKSSHFRLVKVKGGRPCYRSVCCWVWCVWNGIGGGCKLCKYSGITPVHVARKPGSGATLHAVDSVTCKSCPSNAVGLLKL